MTQLVQFNSELIKKYDTTGPRYTSYPTALQFHEGFDVVTYERLVAASNEDLIPRPLSVYMHLPFCHSPCYYCACTKKVTRHIEHGERYLKHLLREIELQGRRFDRDREVEQLHLGGGTPTFFNDQQLDILVTTLGRFFSFAESDDREFSIEIDPRTVNAQRLSRLREMGFNTVSFGIQDFDHEVQKAVNRIQNEQDTLALIAQARALGFHSVSLDLIYGLPMQTVSRFDQTLVKVISARPDRLAVYNYAHLPELFRAQRMINEADLPDASTRLKLMELAISRLTAAGYIYIGMDHFALPEDELTLAQKNGRLQRNFQGYSTRRECDLVGLGMSAIARIGDGYAQNLKTIPGWQDAVHSGELPIWRGITLATEDRLRRQIIESVMCHGQIRFGPFEERFEIDFEEHFMPEIHELKPLAADGLLTLDADGFEATPAGRLLLRRIAMIFDEHAARAEGQQYSRVI